MDFGGETTSQNFTPPQFLCGVPPRLPPTIPAVVDYLYAAIVLIIAVVGIVLNGLVLILVTRYKALRQRSFLLSLQIVVLHLILSSTVLIGSVVVNAIGREWLYGRAACQFMGSVHDSLVSVRFLLMLVLTLDRVFTVFNPFFYTKYAARVSFAMSAVVWIASIVRGIVPLSGILDCYTYIPTFSTCTAVTGCSKECSIYIFTTLTVTDFLGAIVPFFLYLVLFWKAKDIKRRLAIAGRRSSQSSIIRNSRISVKQQDNRAAITFLILFIALLGLTVPAFSFYVSTLIITGPPPDGLLIVQKLFGRAVFFSLAVADPIVIMRNRDVREAADDVRQRLSLRSRSASISDNMRRRSSLAGAFITSDHSSNSTNSNSKEICETVNMHM